MTPVYESISISVRHGALTQCVSSVACDSGKRNLFIALYRRFHATDADRPSRTIALSSAIYNQSYLYCLFIRLAIILAQIVYLNCSRFSRSIVLLSNFRLVFSFFKKIFFIFSKSCLTNFLYFLHFLRFVLFG